MKALAIRCCLVALAVSSTLAVDEHRANACGGCFSVRSTESTVVTDHRMAFSISPAQTVLWDQIKYAGNPKEFSWVLPVRAGAVVQLSNDEWFAALDALTTPTIAGPVRNCGNGGGGIGCGGLSSSSSAGFGSLSDNGVQVITQSVIGPYDTVTVRSTDPHALETWLDVNGYAIPDSFRPTIAAYVSGGFDFIALRLQPGQGVQSMQPVRVVTQGADATLPLRMVAAGVGTQVGITLYVISEGRYEAQSPFFNAAVNDSRLLWLHVGNRSNYQELSQELMQSHGGHTWVTEFAGPMSLVTSQYCASANCGGTVNGNVGSAYYYGGQTLADVYLAQCRGKVSGPCAASDAVNTSDATGASDAPAAEMSDAPADEASDDASITAHVDAGCNRDPCAAFDDLDVALVGLHPRDTWVTRMRAILQAGTLSEGDLHLQASASQTALSNQHTTNVYDDASYSPCGTKGGCNASAADSPFDRWLAVGALGLVAASLVRRRR